MTDGPRAEGFDMSTVMEGMAELLSTWGLRVVGAIAVLVLGWMIARMVRRAVTRALTRSKLDVTLVPFLTSIVYYALLTFVVLAVLNLFGVQTTSFIAVLGAAGLAVGLALQGTLSNFASGLMLLIFRPFQVGDFIDAGGTMGSVQEVGIFSTALHSPDNVRIIVPNSAIYGSTVKNYSFNATRRNDLVLAISYDDDIGKAIETIRATLEAEERVLAEPAPVVAVGELADSSVNLVVRPWCRSEDYWALRWDLQRTLKERLEAAGCSIPYPQRDLHVHSKG